MISLREGQSICLFRDSSQRLLNMDQPSLIKQKIRNLGQSIILVVSMALLCGYLAWLIGGQTFAIFALILVMVGYLLTPSVSHRLIQHLYRGQQISHTTAPRLHMINQALSERAGLPRPPVLMYIPSDVMNAFATGTRDNALIALSDGLLRGLNLRELTAVLAHEMSHIEHQDLRVMSFADIVSRITGLLSMIGQLLLFANLPLLMFSDYHIDWLPIIILLIAPTISTLIQLALSRNREHEADLNASLLTGDPEGLALALSRMERYQGRILEQMLFPGRQIPEPSLLRTHPPTEERIERLLELRDREDWHPRQRLDTGDAEHQVNGLASSRIKPRWHRNGLWY